jgi:cation transport protein ChaC
MSWVFAYGSLMGDNAMAACAARPARLAGYHRAFNHESRARWGRPDGPCPILGLSPGGDCWGVAFELPASQEALLLKRIDRREAAAERRRVSLPVETPAGGVEAWVWLSKPAYANGRAPVEIDGLERRLRAAHGLVGTGSEYIRTMIHAMELHGLRDPLVESLWERLRG